jgi:hypothetical protein
LIFRLAGHLGRTVAELEASGISEYELAEWGVLDELEPWSQRRMDVLIAWLIYKVRTIFAGNDGGRIQPKDYLIDWWPVHKTMTDEEQIAAVKGWAAAAGAGKRGNA